MLAPSRAKRLDQSCPHDFRIERLSLFATARHEVLRREGLAPLFLIAVDIAEHRGNQTCAPESRFRTPGLQRVKLGPLRELTRRERPLQLGNGAAERKR